MDKQLRLHCLGAARPVEGNTAAAEENLVRNDNIPSHTKN